MLVTRYPCLPTRMPAPWTSAALAATASLVALSNARAQSSARQVALHYEVESAVRGCPSATELRAAIVEQVGADPFSGPESSDPYGIHVRVAREGSSLGARLAWSDEAGTPFGERRLVSEDGDCLELARGIAFAVAVQLQLLAGAPRPPSPTAPKAAPKPAPSPAPEPKREPVVITSPARSVLVGLGGLARVGSQPAVAAGLHTFAALGTRAWALAVDAHATLPTSAQAGPESSISAREIGLGAAPCLRRGLLDGCVVGSVTLVSVQGKGVDHARTDSTVGFGLGLRIQLAWPWTERLAAVAHVDVLAQLTQRDVLLNYEPVWSTAPVAVAVGLDVAAIFR